MNPSFKKPYFRNKKLRDSARMEDCTLNLPGCRNERETVVLCHSPYSQHGKGKGIKSEDHFSCYGCYHCHSILDKNYSKPEILAAFFRAMGLTRQRLDEKGIDYPKDEI